MVRILHSHEHFFMVVSDFGKTLRLKADGSTGKALICYVNPFLELEEFDDLDESIKKDLQLYFDF